MNVEQNVNDFLEEEYIKKFTDDYMVVEIIDLPDGTYRKYGGGYQFDIHTGVEFSTFGGTVENPQNYTGYAVVTNSGIRGSWCGQEVEIKEGKVVADVYDIDDNKDVNDVYKILTNRFDIIREEKIKELLK